MIEPKEHKIGPNDLYVAEYIPEEQKFPHPLVLVHGSFGGAFMWKMIASALAKNGFHCYVLSLRGHVPNEITPEILGSLGMQEYADDIKEVVDSLSLESPVVIGHSMSGLIVLMYASGSPVKAVVSIDPSPSLEIQGVKSEEGIPDVYTATDAGMPMDPKEVMMALPDMSQETLMKMKEMLGPESGKARRDRKRGVSISKDNITYPYLVIGGEKADSVKFGINPENIKKMAEYYKAGLMMVPDATHPGILMGEHAPEVVKIMSDWLIAL